MAEPRTPETVVDVFPMIGDAAVPQPSAFPRCRLVLVPQSLGTPVSIQDMHSDSRQFGRCGANDGRRSQFPPGIGDEKTIGVDEFRHSNQGIPRTTHTLLRETALETESLGAGSMPRSVGSLPIFGQTDFGQFQCFRVLTDFGQTDFGQF